MPKPVEAPITVHGEYPSAPVAPRQPSLFDRGKVIPFDAFAPARTGARPQERVQRRPPAARASATVRPGQQPALDFRPRAPRPQTAIHDEATVAPCSERAKAALADGALFGIGLILCAAAFYAMGGRISLAAVAAPGYAGAVGAMLLFYHLFWSILGRDTAGMRMFRLRVITFDGQPPRWGLRVLRLASACLGLMALGLGVLWALFDDEGLTWHDQMTKTYVSVHDPNPSTFHRK